MHHEMPVESFFRGVDTVDESYIERARFDFRGCRASSFISARTPGRGRTRRFILDYLVASTLKLRRRESTRVNRFISRRATRRQRETSGSVARCRGVVLSSAIRHVRRGHVLRLVHPKGGPRGLRVHARSISNFYYARRPRA